MKRKEQAKQSKKSLAFKLGEMRKLNRVYGVGRTPQVVVSLLQSMKKSGIAEQFLTVGTHALYDLRVGLRRAGVPMRWPPVT